MKLLRVDLAGANSNFDSFFGGFKKTQKTLDSQCLNLTSELLLESPESRNKFVVDGETRHMPYLETQKKNMGFPTEYENIKGFWEIT